MGTATRSPSFPAETQPTTPRADSLGAFFVSGVRTRGTTATKGTLSIMSTATTPAADQQAAASATDANSAETGAAAQTPAEEIAELRNGIDTIDAQIAQLVQERTGLSRRIQAARINAGGTRVELGRERVVIDGYRAVLGAEGAVLADAVLRVCRGAR